MLSDLRVHEHNLVSCLLVPSVRWVAFIIVFIMGRHGLSFVVVVWFFFFDLFFVVAVAICVRVMDSKLVFNRTEIYTSKHQMMMTRENDKPILSRNISFKHLQMISGGTDTLLAYVQNILWCIWARLASYVCAISGTVKSRSRRTDEQTPSE